MNQTEFYKKKLEECKDVLLKAIANNDWDYTYVIMGYLNELSINLIRNIIIPRECYYDCLIIPKEIVFDKTEIDKNTLEMTFNLTEKVKLFDYGETADDLIEYKKKEMFQRLKNKYV